MDIKDLNKSQLILLTLLVSFVTSIATGIATVTLLQEVPAPVNQTINRIVQKTIETVTPSDKPNTQTIIIKEEDLIVDAVDKYDKNKVLIKNSTTSDTAGPILGRGFIFSKDGVVAVDYSTAPKDGEYLISAGDKDFKAEWMKSDSKSSLAFLKIIPGQDGIKDIGFTVPDFADYSKMKIGQKLILLGDPILLGTLIGFKDIKVLSNENLALSQGTLADPVETKKSSKNQTASVAEILPAEEEIPSSISFKTLLNSVTVPKSYSGSAVVNLDGEISGFVVIMEGSAVILSVQEVQQNAINLDLV